MARHPLRTALVLSCAALSLAACGKKAPDAVGTPTAEVKVAPPSLMAVAAKVEYKVSETEPATEIAAGQSVTVTPGANVLVGENGHGTLSWPDFVTNDLYSGADSLISLSVPEHRQVYLDQAAGTARYQVAGDGTPAEVKVVANWIEVKVAKGKADFVVSYIPGADPTAWVVSLEGTATVDRKGETVTLNTGEAAAFTADGDLPKPLGVDGTQVKAWLDALGTGTAKTSIAGVAFRCEVKADDAALRDTPSEDAAAGDKVPAGTLVIVTERDETASWLKVRLLDGSGEGWLPADALSCLAPPADAPVIAVALHQMQHGVRNACFVQERDGFRRSLPRHRTFLGHRPIHGRIPDPAVAGGLRRIVVPNLWTCVGLVNFHGTSRQPQSQPRSRASRPGRPGRPDGMPRGFDR